MFCEISSPLWAGISCMNRKSGLAYSTRDSFTWYGAKVSNRSFFSSSSPILTQTSVYITSASFAASSGSGVHIRVVPLVLEISWADFQISIGNWYCSGEEIEKSIPASEQAISKLPAMLFPSPMKATFKPSSFPLCSYTVRQSPMAWQGWPLSERAFITGRSVLFANFIKAAIKNK